MLARLPATVHAFILVELQKWPTLFGPEQRYQRALLEHCRGLPRPELDQRDRGRSRASRRRPASHRLTERNPARFQDAAQALLRKRGLHGRLAQRGRRVLPGSRPGARGTALSRRCSSPSGRPDLWQRHRGPARETVEPLQRRRRPSAAEPGRDEQHRTVSPGVVWRARARAAASALFAGAATASSPLDAWLIESHEALHALCDAGPTDGAAVGGALTGLSYDRLRAYRDDLTRALNSKIQSGVESPQAFAAYARSLQIAPPAGALLYSADVLLAFVRDVLLTGNGTLLMNNTFVEWAAVQALKRAQPRILITRFGVRDKLRPFSSMVMFSQPRPSDHSRSSRIRPDRSSTSSSCRTTSG